MLGERAKQHKGSVDEFNLDLLEDGAAADDYESDYLTTDEEATNDGTSDKEKIEVILKRMDKNKDDYIEWDEITMWIFKALHVVDVHDLAEDDFEEMDTDKDKKVSWDEYIKYEFEDAKGWDANKDGKVDNTETYIFNKEFSRLSTRFYVAADLGGWSRLKPTTSLTLEQYKKFVNPFKVEKFLQNFKMRALKLVDHDNDGYITKQEFDNDWAKKPDDLDEVIKKESERGLHDNGHLYKFLRDERILFHALDFNGDDKISGMELVMWLSPTNVILTRDEVDTFFELAGKKAKHDKKLSFSEIRDIADHWFDHTAIVRDSYFHHNEL